MGGEQTDLMVAVARAVRHFWETRERQATLQGRRSGKADRGGRRAATGGAQLDGFADLIQRLVENASSGKAKVYRRTHAALPGYYRAEKTWDLVVMHNQRLLAAIELKAQVGPSFGNNYNNRAEEAIGSATDYWAAFREGAFVGKCRPWLGYLMLLEDAAGARRPVSVKEPHFRVFEEFRDVSYAKRYEILLLRLIRDRLYDAACLILSPREEGRKGRFSEPSEELSFTNFAERLLAHVIGYTAISG